MVSNASFRDQDFGSSARSSGFQSGLGGAVAGGSRLGSFANSDYSRVSSGAVGNSKTAHVDLTTTQGLLGALSSGVGRKGNGAFSVKVSDSLTIMIRDGDTTLLDTFPKTSGAASNGFGPEDLVSTLRSESGALLARLQGPSDAPPRGASKMTDDQLVGEVLEKLSKTGLASSKQSIASKLTESRGGNPFASSTSSSAGWVERLAAQRSGAPTSRENGAGGFVAMENARRRSASMGGARRGM